MTREEVRGLIEKTGILPASIVFRGKIPVVELTMTVPGEVGVIRELARMHPGWSSAQVLCWISRRRTIALAQGQRLCVPGAG